MLPTVFRRARGWISDCDSTVVWARNRSTMPRTNGRMPPDVTSTGRFALARGVLEPLAHQGDEFRKA